MTCDKAKISNNVKSVRASVKKEYTQNNVKVEEKKKRIEKKNSAIETNGNQNNSQRKIHGRLRVHSNESFTIELFY